MFEAEFQLWLINLLLLLSFFCRLPPVVHCTALSSLPGLANFKPLAPGGSHHRHCAIVPPGLADNGISVAAATTLQSR